MRLQPGTALLYGLLRIVQRLDRRARDVSDFDPEKIQRILLVSTTALGDTVMSTAGMHAVRVRYPRAYIAGLLHPVNGKILKYSRNLDARIEYSGRYRDFLPVVGRLRRMNFDVALILHGNEPQITPLLYLAGIPFIFKLPNVSKYSFLLSNREPKLDKSQIKHALRRRMHITELIGASASEARMRLDIPEEQREAMNSLLSRIGVDRQAPLIGFQAGASSRERFWPASRFSELGRALCERYPTSRIILTGSPAESRLCAEIAHAIGPAAISLAGRLELETLPALIARMSVLVTGDTGTMHIAIATRTPSVCLFGASSPADTGPTYDLERHLVIAKQWDAETRSTVEEPMARIGVDEVLSSIELLVHRFSNGFAPVSQH